MSEENQGKETDYMVYRGNAVPRVIRLVWTAFFIFSIYYLASFMWPDLKEMMGEWLK